MKKRKIVGSLWLVEQGRSKAKVRATDYFAAKKRAAQIGFKKPWKIIKL